LATVLVTGIAGFIGFHLSRLLLQQGHSVIGIDAFTPYYDVTLKRRRAAILEEFAECRIHEVALEEAGALDRVAAEGEPQIVIHLAAQPGVRYSLAHPRAYIEANLVGTFNILEFARARRPQHLLVASTSSVYGANTKLPFDEGDPTDHPLTLYAATKKSCEVMAHSYSHLWGIPTTVFRFFTVYGPWGRPDMALFIFTERILQGLPIDIHNHGNMQRDFTYVDDLVEAVAELAHTAPPDPRGLEAATRPRDLDLSSDVAPFRIVNIGRSSPVGVMEFVDAIERCIGRPAARNLIPMQPGEVERTFASTERLHRIVPMRQSTPIEVGVRRFVDWYRCYYGV